MKKFIITGFAIFTCTLISSLVLGQTANTTIGCVPLEVKFSTPIGSEKYFWDFKDGVTSIKQNPVNIFSSPGTYDVTFHESSAGPAIKTITIEVLPVPVPYIGVASLGCLPYNAEFVNKTQISPSITVTNYTWVFGDGQKSEGVENPSHTFNQLGFFDISLEIETEFPTCNTTKSFPSAVEVTTPPTASFTSNPASLFSCSAPLNATFTNTSSGSKPLSYLWTMDNGQTSIATHPPAQYYDEGNFTVNLDVSYTNTPSCESSISKNISVGSPKPNISIRDDTICLREITMVSSNTPGSYQWNFGPNNINTNNNSPNRYGVGYSVAGDHTINLKVTSPDGKCTGDTSITVYVHGFEVEATSSPTYSCQTPVTIDYDFTTDEKDIKHFWTFGKLDNKDPLANDSIVTNPTRTYNNSFGSSYYGTNEEQYINASLIVRSNRTSCSVTKTIVDTLCLPNALFKPNRTQGCAPLNVTLQDSSSHHHNQITTWIWNYGDGFIDTTYTSLGVSNHVYQTPGEYHAFLVVKTIQGCTDTSYSSLIKVGRSLSDEVDFETNLSEVCAGDPVTFAITKSSPLIDSYRFKTEENRSPSTCDDNGQLTWSYNNKAGYHDVELIVEYNGCLSSVVKHDLVNVKGPLAKIDYSAPCSDPLNYTFNSKSDNATKVNWSFGDGNTSQLTSASNSYATSEDYTVTLTASNETGCPPSIAQEKIRVRQIKAEINVDTLLCIKSGYLFQADSSKNVHTTCHNGYTWLFPTLPHKRPLSTSSANTEFSFDVAGGHTAMLVVKDTNGCKDTASVDFKVYDMTVDATADDLSICNPATVSFSDLSTGDTTLVSWQWHFGDEQIIENEQNPTHQYVNPADKGFYSVKLILTDELGCKDDYSFKINHYKPVSNILATKNGNICFGDSLELSATEFTTEGSGLKYIWDFGNEETAMNNFHTILYDTAKSYTVKLYFKEIHSGCQDSTSKTINIQTYPEAGFYSNVDTILPLCAPRSVTFTDTSQSNSPLTRFWDFKNGQTAFSSPFSLTYNKGIYEPTLIVQTSYGCADTVSKTYNLYRPEARIEVDKNTICKGEEILFTIRDTSDISKYTWYFGDGDTLANQNSVAHLYNFHPPSGHTVAKLAIEGKNGRCPRTIDYPINIHQVIADFKRDSTICFNDGPYKFFNASTNGNTLHWDFGDGAVSAEHNPIHQYESTGLYNVTLTISDNQTACRDTIVKVATIYKNPELTVLGDTACLGSLLSLNVINPIAEHDYLWTPTANLSNPNNPNQNIILDATTTFTVVETDTNNCKDKKELIGRILKPVELNDWDTTIMVGDIATIPVIKPDLYIFNWSPSEGLNCLDCNYPTTRPMEDITYQLTVTDSLGCFKDHFNQTVSVKPETFVKLPSTFTPNGDGLNDAIYVKGWGIKELLDFRIFNRWGQEVYSSSNLDQGWDGTFKGKIQNSDVYVYKVKVLTWRNEELYNEGYINLVH